jgi:hypothetical protein
MLHVIQFGVDDRAVLQLNGVDVTGVGTTTSGSGEMQFSDPGSTAPYNFANVSGQHAVTSSAGFQTGLNTLAIIDNNTNSGIFGSITPITGGDPSNVGLQSYVTYTYP